MKTLICSVLLLVACAATATDAPGSAVAVAELAQGGIARVRVASVRPSLAGVIKEHLARLAAGTALKGLVLDLRFADGGEYADALAVTDLFLATERTLLKVDGKTHKSAPKTDALIMPVVALVNGETGGAAELLAALLREHRVALLLGSRTAGRLPLDAEKFRLPSGVPLPADGLAPDITETVSLADERKFIENPRAELAPAKLSSTNTVAATSPRLNEAELVRRQREGPGFDTRAVLRGAAREPSASAVRDPALARALELLQGLAAAKQARVF